jgi:hypothetical protein
VNGGYAAICCTRAASQRTALGGDRHARALACALVAAAERNGRDEKYSTIGDLDGAQLAYPRGRQLSR